MKLKYIIITIMSINEKNFESIVCDELKKLGFEEKYEINKVEKKEVVDWEILKEQIIKINKTTNENANKIIFELKKISDLAIQSNIQGFNFLKNGVKVFDNKQKRPINFHLFSENINLNKWFFIRQFEISDGITKRIPDVIVFLNGMPISILELKSPIANEGTKEAWKQNESLKKIAPQLFTFNIFNFISNHISNKFGSITSGFRRYFNLGDEKDWTKNLNPIQKIFNKDILIKIIKQFTFFDNKNEIKYLAAPHQIIAVNETIKILKNSTNNKGGIVWHTQGSGKSITMLMLTRAILNNFPKSTILIVTDRNTLDKQLFERFIQASEYFLMSIPKEVNSRNDLIQKLNDKKHFGIFFTTVQKFSIDTGSLSKRDDIFILVDEAHRTQNNVEGKSMMSKKTREFIIKYGYAKYMREAFPNAKLMGFTGTPLMGVDKNTTNVFGNYNHIYSMKNSVKDGFTVKIFYESIKLNIPLNKQYLNKMDNIQLEYWKSLNPNDVQSQWKMNSLLKDITIKHFLENINVIKVKVKSILEHLKIRSEVLHGKAMLVASTRKAAFRYYQEIIKQDPSRENTTILVITSSNKDSIEMMNKIVPKTKINEVATEFRKPNSKYKIAIVVDMWLTGFDVLDLDVMYIDKMMKWHNLMQAIARVNRTYEENGLVKKSGLIVDYLGIWDHISKAMVQYASGKEKEFDILIEDVQKAKEKLLDIIDIISSNYIKNINTFNNLNPKEHYKFIINASEIILNLSIEEKTKFIRLASKTKKLLKITFTIISSKKKIIAKTIEAINALIFNKSTWEDKKLEKTKENIKKIIKKILDSSKVDIVIKSTQSKKDINQVAKLLEEEAKEIRKNNPLFAIQLYKDAINSNLEIQKKIRPAFFEKMSDRLKKILLKLEKEGEIDEVIDMLINLSKEITKKIDEKPEYEDPYMQAFYTILADDKYLKRNKSSEILRKIAEELMKMTKDKAKDGIKTLTSKNKLEYALRKILKLKYNYPPKELGGISGILIDKIKGIIDSNPEYFVGKKEI